MLSLTDRERKVMLPLRDREGIVMLSLMGKDRYEMKNCSL